MTGFQLHKATHSYPVWLLLARGVAERAFAHPGHQVFCASVRVHRQQDKVEQGLRARGYPRLLENG